MSVWASSSVTTRMTSIKCFFQLLFGLMKLELSVWRQAAQMWQGPWTPAQGSKATHGSLLGISLGTRLCASRAVIQPSLFICHLLYVCPLKRWSNAEDQVRWPLLCRLKAKLTCHHQDHGLVLPAFSHPVQFCKTTFEELILMDESCAQGPAVKSV